MCIYLTVTTVDKVETQNITMNYIFRWWRHNMCKAEIQCNL